MGSPIPSCNSLFILNLEKEKSPRGINRLVKEGKRRINNCPESKRKLGGVNKKEQFSQPEQKIEQQIKQACPVKSEKEVYFFFESKEEMKSARY